MLDKKGASFVFYFVLFVILLLDNLFFLLHLSALVLLYDVP